MPRGIGLLIVNGKKNLHDANQKKKKLHDANHAKGHVSVAKHLEFFYGEYVNSPKLVLQVELLNPPIQLKNFQMPNRLKLWEFEMPFSTFQVVIFQNS